MIPSIAPEFPEGFSPVLVQRYLDAKDRFAAEFLPSEVAPSKPLDPCVDEWYRQGRIFAVEYKGKIKYPTFQFTQSGALKAGLAPVLAAFPENANGWEVALWFISANSRLGGERPVDHLDRGHGKLVKARKAENEIEWF